MLLLCLSKMKNREAPIRERDQLDHQETITRFEWRLEDAVYVGSSGRQVMDELAGSDTSS